MKNWKFKSVHPKDIDFYELTNSVTRQDPLALVKGSYTAKETRYRPLRTKEGYIVHTDGTARNDKNELVLSHTPPSAKFDEFAPPQTEAYTATIEREENYVVVHRSLYDKSLVAAIDLPTALAPKLANAVGARVYAGVKTAEFRNWIAWAKEVKAATWHDEDRRKATFVVDMPKI